MKQAALIIFLFCFLPVCANNLKTLHFNFRFGDEAFYLNKEYIFKNDTITFTTLKFYISGIRLLKNGNVIYEEPKSFHLVDAENVRDIQIAMGNNMVFDEIQFNLGIDSATNSGGAMGGDLDPLKGMYWTWQSGYINIKTEGKNSSCLAPRYEFEFHSGGYMNPYPTIQKISGKVISDKSIVIVVDMKKFIGQTDFTKAHHVLSPGPAAVTVSENFAKCLGILSE